ncbi:uncharacterized protein LOC132187952 [Corylus avellana]|uniref:uncharacterized protein LOC132187952 n=1 Tax=Corylus avellana TaxID=13451 RepID=UPI00286D59F5|nr:uncharacterized protein LOC132187952 [Corylus avellana]
MSEDAFDYISKIDPRMWSRHAFRNYSCSDILTNNTAECFNAWILEARDKPILGCMELIRRQLMGRFNQKRARAETSKNEICPKIVKKLERNKSLARNYICHWSNRLQFEVNHSHEPRRIVDLGRRTCGCGRWQLNGIPCPHAVSAIYFHRQVPEKYVSQWYFMDTFRKSYAPDIYPIPSTYNEWPVDHDVEPILPPIPKKTKRSCRQPDNPNKKIWPKKVVKAKPNNETEGGSQYAGEPTTTFDNRGLISQPVGISGSQAGGQFNAGSHFGQDRATQ